ncbi:MAG: hypothetical protein M3550_05990 [Actinomycetota bacterium]|nr:hypothetical protein [Actinomycetota bacterium]
MTAKAAFNAEEWSTLVEAPALVALRVIAAERGGTLRESLSLGRAYVEARKGVEDELLGAIVSSAPQIDKGGLEDPEGLAERTDQGLSEALRLLEQKATPEEAEAYRRFVLSVGDTVAHAHREGGFLALAARR